MEKIDAYRYVTAYFLGEKMHQKVIVSDASIPK